MAEKAQTQSTFSAYSELAAQVGGSDTVTDLFKLANSDAFKDAAHKLTPDDLKSLRTVYRERMKELDGKVKLQDYAGQTLLITDIEWWHSETWNNDGVTLRFRVEGESQKLKALTSSAPVVRFCNGLDPMPTDDHPVRILLGLRPVNDKTRAAQGQKIFTIKRLASPTTGDGSEGAPF